METLPASLLQSAHQQLTSSLNGIEPGVPNEILHRLSIRTGTPPRRAEHRHPTPVAFGSRRFYESRYGEAFDWVLDRLSQEISGLLACPPGDRAFD